MKKIFFNIICLATLVLTLTFSLTSCEDFLTITPSNQIVEEEFWEDRKDLENVVAACYTQLIGLMGDYIVWGEMRGDNVAQTTGNSNTNIRNLMNANLIPSNYLFDWTDLYKEINFCNKILAHGPEVVARDESFSSHDWEPIAAEVKTLRALAHFYLLRVWGDVPYVTIDYNNDSQDFLLPQTKQEQVLDSIILDLESVKDLAMNSYGNDTWDKGRVTKKTVRTLLADVYLWRASLLAPTNQQKSQDDYQKCVECCDWVIKDMIADRVKKLNKEGKILGGVTEDDLTVEDMIIPNERSVKNKYISDNEVGAFSHIFGSGNSMEAIFELQIDGTQNSNGANGYFWNLSSSTIGGITSCEAIVNTVNDTPNDISPTSIFTKTDYRRWECLHFTKSDQLDFPIYKYAATSQTQYNGASAGSSVMQDNSATNYHCEYSTRSTTNNSCNWIFYRFSDLLLMKAEAMSQIYSDEEHLMEAFQLCRHIFRRSNPYAYATNNMTAKNDTLNFTTFSTQENLETLVMQERQREFFGEGKRWFDLVRYAQRKGGTSDMLKKFLGHKYSENKNAIYAKLSTLPSLFSPIHTDQMKANPLLYQNAVWNQDESTSKTDNL